jgi:hypothetical protein
VCWNGFEVGWCGGFGLMGWIDELGVRCKEEVC